MTPIQTSSGPCLLTIQQTAHRLAISPRLVRTVAHTGGLPCVRIGRLLRFRPEDVDQFIRLRLSVATRDRSRPGLDQEVGSATP
ncbi:MAG: Helix-turn-helix domain [Frankiales bacterium]|jgi:excisionase family DNA binding protein|nr:Helix-turn-helix domain [Frankiales bacterium]